MIFVVLSVVIMEKILSWDVQPDKFLVELPDPSKMTARIYQTTRCYIPENGYLLNRGKKVSPFKMFLTSRRNDLRI